MRRALGLLVIVFVVILGMLVYSYDNSNEFVSESIPVYQVELVEEYTEEDVQLEGEDDYSDVGLIVDNLEDVEEEDIDEQESYDYWMDIEQDSEEEEDEVIEEEEELVEDDYESSEETSDDDELIVDDEPVEDNVEDFSSYSEGCMSGGDTFGIWEVVFAGYGCVEVVDEVLTMEPAKAEDGETHAALVVGDSFEGSLEVDVRTVEQLKDTSEYWETAWVAWNYEDNEHFYYFILKENGYELGKRDPAYEGNQRFLVTGNEITLDIGEWNNFRIEQDGGYIEVYVDGVKILYFLDEETPYTSGKVGFYTEDALVEFDNVNV